MGNLRCLMFLCLGISVTVAHNFLPCENTQPLNSYEYLSSSNYWKDSIFGFCHDLFTEQDKENASDIVLPIQNISCLGESGSEFSLMRTSMGYVGYSCRVSFAKLMCLLHFPKVRSNSNQLIALPCTNQQADPLISNPLNLTSWFQSNCQSSNHLISFNNITSILSKVDTWLTNSTYRTICRVVDGGNNEIIEDKHSNWVPKLWECPNGMIKKNEVDLISNSESGCGLSCPSPIFSNGEWDLIQSRLNILNTISAIGCLFCIIHWTTISERMRFPAVMIYNVMICIFLLHISIMIGSFHGITNQGKGCWCSIGNEIDSYDTATCMIQGSLIIYFFKASVLWIIMVIFNTYFVSVYDAKFKISHSIFYYLLGYGYPALFVIICASVNEIRPSDLLLWCFFSSEDRDYNAIVLFIDCFIFLGIGASAVLITFNYILKIQKKLELRGRKAIIFSGKIFILIIYLILILILFLVQQNSTVGENKIEVHNLEKKWINCSFTEYYENISKSSFVSSNQNSQINYSHCLIKNSEQYTRSSAFTLLLCGTGIVATLLFGFTREIYSVWQNFGKKVFGVKKLTHQQQQQQQQEQDEKKLNAQYPDNCDRRSWGRKYPHRTFDYIFFGGGTACGYAAQEFVKQGLKPGQLAIISREAVPSYERFFLTNEFLKGAKINDHFTCSAENGQIQDPDWYRRHGIQLILQTEIIFIDGVTRNLESSSGEIFKARKGLVIATGSMVMRLTIVDMPSNIFKAEIKRAKEQAQKENYEYLSKLDSQFDEKSAKLLKRASYRETGGGGSVGIEISGIASSNSSPEFEEFRMSEKKPILSQENEIVMLSQESERATSFRELDKDYRKYCENPYYLRNYADACHLKQTIDYFLTLAPELRKCIVIGGGYIGLECASSLASSGIQVTLIVRSGRLAKGILTTEMSAMYERYYTSRGVTIFKNSPAKEIVRVNDMVGGCRLEDGRLIEGNFILVGLGSRPASELLNGQLAMKEFPNGKAIWVDGSLQTSIQGVYAIGDVISLPFHMYGQSQLEHALNARRSGEHVARVLSGKISVYDYHPCIFGQFFDLKWKMWGDNGTPRYITVGNLESKFLTLWIWENRIQGAFLQGGTIEDENKLVRATKEQTKVSMKKLKLLRNVDEVLYQIQFV